MDIKFEKEILNQIESVCEFGNYLIGYYDLKIIISNNEAKLIDADQRVLFVQRFAKGDELVKKFPIVFVIDYLLSDKFYLNLEQLNKAISLFSHRHYEKTWIENFTKRKIIFDNFNLLDEL